MSKIVFYFSIAVVVENLQFIDVVIVPQNYFGDRLAKSSLQRLNKTLQPNQLVLITKKNIKLFYKV